MANKQNDSGIPSFVAWMAFPFQWLLKQVLGLFVPMKLPGSQSLGAPPGKGSTAHISQGTGGQRSAVPASRGHANIGHGGKMYAGRQADAPDNHANMRVQRSGNRR